MLNLGLINSSFSSKQMDKLFSQVNKFAGDKVGKIVQEKATEFMGNKSSETKKYEMGEWNPVKQDARRRALLIGINYFGQKGELKGCINDVSNMKEFISSKCNFSDIKVLTDDQDEKPTRDNIIAAFKWLVQDVKEGDSLFLHYSGHGAFQADADNDEADNQDETICPVDYDSAGMIVDDEIHSLLVRPLFKGVKLTAVFDCCHSASAMDLPFMYRDNGEISVVVSNDKYKQQAVMSLIQAGIAGISGDKEKGMRALTQGVKLLMKKENKAAQDNAEKEKRSEADVVMLSGCMDCETSADAKLDGKATGALSHA